MLKLVNNQSDTIDLDAIKTLVSKDMGAVDALIQQCLHTDVALIDQLSHYIINSGGKRLRPMLVLLYANACQYQGDSISTWLL